MSRDSEIEIRRRIDCRDRSYGLGYELAGKVHYSVQVILLSYILQSFNFIFILFYFILIARCKMRSPRGSRIKTPFGGQCRYRSVTECYPMNSMFPVKFVLKDMHNSLRCEIF